MCINIPRCLIYSSTGGAASANKSSGTSQVPKVTAAAPAVVVQKTSKDAKDHKEKDAAAGGDTKKNIMLPLLSKSNTDLFLLQS